MVIPFKSPFSGKYHHFSGFLFTHPFRKIDGPGNFMTKISPSGTRIDFCTSQPKKRRPCPGRRERLLPGQVGGRPGHRQQPRPRGLRGRSVGAEPRASARAPGNGERSPVSHGGWGSTPVKRMARTQGPNLDDKP